MNILFLHKARSMPFNILGLVILFISVQASYSWAPEKQTGEWSSPETIPGYEAETWPPILIADQDRTVHAFTSQWVDIDGGRPIKAIFYSQWSADYGWTEPIDILLASDGEARVTDAYLDNDGIIHVVFWGGDGTHADIYYSEAPAADADNALAWTAPMLIGENAGDPEAAVFAKDEQGTQFVIYSSRKNENGIYAVNSTDGGDTWSDPVSIFEATAEEPNISQLHVTRSKSGWLHVIWDVYDIGGQGRGIYYSRSKDGMDWSESLLLESAPEGLGTQTPAIIEYKDILYVVYNLTPKIMMRRSLDNGITWDDPVTMFSRHVGVNGSLSLVIDSNNELHLFFGQRISGNPDIHGMWHSVFLNGRWTEPDAVVKGPRIVDNAGYSGFDPYEAHAVVSQGNVILVTWRTDLLSLGNGVWYSYQTLDAPQLPITPLPGSETIGSDLTIGEGGLATPTVSPEPISTMIVSTDEAQKSTWLGWVILAAIAVVILAIVAIRTNFKKN